MNSAQPALAEEQAHENPGAEHKDTDGVIHPQQVREMQESFAEMTRPIVLIGPMAAGKTYIGTHLARFYGYEFLDVRPADCGALRGGLRDFRDFSVRRIFGSLR